MDDKTINELIECINKPVIIDGENDNRKLTTCDNRILTTPSFGRKAG